MSRVVALLMTVGLLGLASTVPAAAAPAPVTFAPAPGHRYVGVSANGIGPKYDAFLKAAGEAHVAFYDRYTQDNGDVQWILDEFRTRHVGGMISWSLPGMGTQASVADGVEDPVITRVANEVRSYGKPVMIRLNWEFNGSWYPWSSATGTGTARAGNSPADYVAAWRHVVSMFRTVPNVTFVWSPNLFVTIPGSTERISDWYPGDAYVGWVGMDAYPTRSSWDWMQHAPDGLDDIDGFAVSHRKPLMLAEWALSNPGTGDSRVVMARMLSWMDAHPELQAEFYFDYRNADGTDYRLAAFPHAARFFATWLKGPRNVTVAPG